MHFPALLGHPKEKAEQRPDWTAGLDWQPLWSQEKGRGRAGCPQGEDCESLYCHFPVLDWEILCRWEVESTSPLSRVWQKAVLPCTKMTAQVSTKWLLPTSVPSLSLQFYIWELHRRPFCMFWQGSRWLILYEPKLLVVGCNTADDR